MAKIGTPLLESGSMKESNTPVCENGNGPSSLKQIQWHSELRFAGRLSAGHTIDSSYAVRVTDEKTPLVAHSGTVASGSMRTMAYAPGSQRNLSWGRPGCWGFLPSSYATGMFLSSFMTLRDRARLHRRGGYPRSKVKSSTAFAWRKASVRPRPPSCWRKCSSHTARKDGSASRFPDDCPAPADRRLPGNSAAAEGRTSGAAGDDADVLRPSRRLEYSLGWLIGLQN